MEPQERKLSLHGDLLITEREVRFFFNLTREPVLQRGLGFHMVPIYEVSDSLEGLKTIGIIWFKDDVTL